MPACSTRLAAGLLEVKANSGVADRLLRLALSAEPRRDRPRTPVKHPRLHCSERNVPQKHVFQRIVAPPLQRARRTHNKSSFIDGRRESVLEDAKFCAPLLECPERICRLRLPCMAFVSTAHRIAVAYGDTGRLPAMCAAAAAASTILQLVCQFWIGIRGSGRKGCKPDSGN